MPTKITIRDETTAGESSDAITLEFLTEHITIRELIRQRLYQEVKDFNAQQHDTFKGLVQPTGAEKALNGFKVAKHRQIDWQEQYEKACQAFERNQILVLVDQRQAESLEEQITLTPDTEVTFLKLVMLVGG